MIHIGRAGTKLGSFSEVEVRRGLASGRFFLSDLGWKEGMESWAPLSTFPEFSPDEPMPPLPGADLPVEAEADAAPPGPAGLPWDHRKEFGFLGGFLGTFRMIIFNPAEAFARMHVEGNINSPLLYNIIGGWFGLVCSGIYLVVMARMQPGPPANASDVVKMFYVTPEKAMGELKLFLIMGPIMVFVSTIIASGIAHLLLMVAGGANKQYHVTLRVFCYAYGSVQLLQILPFCGSVLSPALMVVYCVIGLAIAHGTTTGRSGAAMALFIVAFAACCLATLFMAVGANLGTLHDVLNP